MGGADAAALGASEPDRVVYCRVMMGLGNQMFQYAAGRALAAHLGVELVVDLAMYGGAGSYGGTTPRRYELDDVFGLHLRVATESERRCFSYSQPVRRAFNKLWYRRHPLTQGLPYEQPWLVDRVHRVRQRFRPAHSDSTYFEPHFHFDPGFFGAAAPVYLIGHWQSWRYSEAILEGLRAELSPRPELVADVADLGAHLRATRSVSLHVRLSDHLDPRYSSIFARLGADYYRRALDAVVARNGDVDVYVFSDDPAGARSILGDLPVTIVSGELSTSPAQDLHLMSLCRHHVIANSSFSWWAARLGSADGSTTVAPARWYATRRYDTRDLLPPSWLTVPN
jgi:hypothetical protein